VFRTRFISAAALAVAFVMPAAAFAQTAPVAPPAAHAHHRGAMREALGQLNLSPDQRTRLDAAFAEAKQAREANRNADPATRKANRDAFMGKIDAILSPDQRTQFHASMAKMRAERKQHAS